MDSPSIGRAAVCGSSSLKQRLEALTKSKDSWQKRVKKGDNVMGSSIEQRSKLLADSSMYHRGKENTDIPSSPTEIQLSNIDKGLDTFFPHIISSAQAHPVGCEIEMDLDCVQKTEILCTPRRPRPRARCSGVKKSSEAAGTNILAELCSSQIVIEEDPRDKIDVSAYSQGSLSDSDTDEAVGIASSAKRGLQAIENYSTTKMSLRKADTKFPYPPVMLIRVKGAKHVDVRLVAPVWSSVHQGGVFILVTPDRLCKYEGSRSNILERTKASQICIEIVTKSDLHCKAKQIENVTVSSQSFFRLLEGTGPSEDPVLPMEPFEKVASRLNLVLRVTPDYQLQSVVKGERVRFGLLLPNETLIFDFGSEVYVWSGRNAKKTSGRYAAEYASQLLKRGVPGSKLTLGAELLEQRPKWVLFRKVVQGVQDILFSSKFSDWQTRENLLGAATLLTPNKCYLNSPPRDQNREISELADGIRELEYLEPELVLEDHRLTRSMHDVITEGVEMWQLAGEQLSPLEYTSHLQDNRCYVVRWQYRIQISGVRRLRTGEEREEETGRVRVAFFYWLGRESTVKQHGLCALRLDSMDRDKFPHIRVAQGSEPPAFLWIFGGSLVIESPSSSTPWFLVLGATKEEAHAVQLPDGQLFRSHAVYVSSNGPKSKLTLVAGLDCHTVSVQCALQLCHKWNKDGGDELSVTQTVQGDDPSLVWLTASGRSSSRPPRAMRIVESSADLLPCPQYHPHLQFIIQQQQLTDLILVDLCDKQWLWSERAPSTYQLSAVSRVWQGKEAEIELVMKGSEPDAFIALFPTWEQWPSGDEKEELQKTPVHSLKAVLAERTRTYPLAQLRSREGLPEGLDRSALERFLTDDDFSQAFAMDRSQFHALPAWKQVQLRQKANLF